MKKLVLLFFLSIAILVSSVTISHAQTYGPVFLVEYNTDRQGGDIRSGFPVGNVGQCMNECANSSQCRAFTLVDVNQQPPNYNNDRPLCWLKRSVPGKRKNSGMITGVKQ